MIANNQALPPDGTGFRDYGFGSISRNFGSTNLDNMPSSGGTAGYTRAVSSPTVVSVLPVSSSGASAQPAINPTQSGDVGSTLDKLISVYGSQFGAPSPASTSGGPVVIVPDPATGAGGGAGVSPQLVGLVALGAAGFFLWRWYQRRADA